MTRWIRGGEMCAGGAQQGARGSGAVGGTMLAARFHGGPDGLHVEEVPVPEPGRGEVLVDVAACGLCGSDVHFLDGMPVPATLPLTLGHEPAGTIAALGEGVEGWAIGDRVAVGIGPGCGACRTCRLGAPEACPNQRATGLHFDGALAEAVAVPAAALVRVREDVSLTAAAVATDCVASPYHALRCRAALRPGEQVVVIGIGGLGSMAVELALHLRAQRVVAVDRSPAALKRAERLGAERGVLVPDGASAASVMSEVRDATDGGAEVVLECVGRPDTTELGGWSLVPGGRLVLVGVGLAPPPIPYPQALFTVGEYSVIGSFASHRDDIVAVLDLDAEGVIDIDSTVSHEVGLEEVPAGFAQLREHRDDPQRIVMVNR